MLEIRAKVASDDEVCVALMAKTHALDGYPRHWPAKPARFLRPRQETDGWVAELDGRVVGQVALHEATNDPVTGLAQAATQLPLGQITVLARLLVDPGVRGQGVGRALLRTAVARAPVTGRRPALDVLQESAGAIAFYESERWTRLGAISLDLTRLGYGDVPPLELWVYLGPAVPSGGTTSDGSGGPGGVPSPNGRPPSCSR